MKNLIIGYVSDFTWSQIEPFAVSAVMNVRSADVVIITEGISRVCEDILHNLGIKVSRVSAEQYTGYKPNDYRWFSIREYLEQHKEEYRQVACCGVRDVVFTGDLFEQYENHSYLGLSLEAFALKDSLLNVQWMETKFGKQEREKHGDRIIINSDVVWGTLAEVCQVVDKMITVMFPENGDYYPLSDQTSLQYVIYNSLVKVDNIVYSDVLSTNAPVGSIGSMKEEQIEHYFKKNSVCVVHQYDRFYKLTEEYFNKYRLEKYSEIISTDFYDINDILELIYVYIRKKNYADAIRIMMQACEQFENKDFWSKARWNSILFLVNACTDTSLFACRLLKELLITFLLKARSGRYFVENLEKVIEYLKSVDKLIINMYAVCEMSLRMAEFWKIENPERAQRLLLLADVLQCKGE